MTTRSNIRCGAWALLFLLIATAANAGDSRLMPRAEPDATDVGGSSQSDAAVAKLKQEGVETKVVRGMEGPSSDGGETRHSIHTYRPTAAELPGVEGYLFRSSFVDVAPGGIVPIHPHAGRPAFLKVLNGTITQHRSDGTSLQMNGGDVTFASDKVAHWWQNKSSKLVNVWVVDLCKEGKHPGCDSKMAGGAVQPKLSDRIKTEPSGEGKPSPRELGQIELSEELDGDVGGRVLRFREVTLPPDAPRRAHDHVGRPNYFMVVQGTLYIHGPQGQQRLVPGDVMLEEGAGLRAFSVAGEQAVILNAVDVVDPAAAGGEG